MVVTGLVYYKLMLIITLIRNNKIYSNCIYTLMLGRKTSVVLSSLGVKNSNLYSSLGVKQSHNPHIDVENLMRNQTSNGIINNTSNSNENNYQPIKGVNLRLHQVAQK